MEINKTDHSDSVDYSIWENIQKKGVLIFTIAIYGMAIGGAIIICGYVFFLLCQCIELINRSRKALGFAVPESGPDWLVLVLIACIICAMLTILLIMLRWYNHICDKKLKKVWPRKFDRMKYSRMNGRINTKGYSHAQYIRELLQSPVWREKWEDVCKKIPDKYPVLNGISPETLTDEECRAAAAGIAAIVRIEIAKRALAVALLTGFSRKRWVDQLAICIAGLDIQIEVLGMLGKKLTLKYWRIMLKRTLASIFVNSFFNQQQVSDLIITIKSFAMGFSIVIENASDLLDASDAPVDEIFDSLRSILGNSGGGPLLGDILAMLEKGTSASLIGLDLTLSAGASASRILAVIIEKIGDDVLEASLAGGILYYHGMELLRETLPFDEDQRESPEFKPSPYDCAVEIARSGGYAIRDLVRARRKQFVKRRIAAAKAMVNKIPIVGKILNNNTKS